MIPAAAIANLLCWGSLAAAFLNTPGGAALVGAGMAGLFGLLNTTLQTLILRQARRNAELAQQTQQRVGVVHDTAREAVDELEAVKKRVDRRKGSERPPEGRDRRRRKSDPPGPIQ